MKVPIKGMKYKKFFTLPTLFLMLLSCAGENYTPVDPNDHTLSVIFGYFDMENAPSKFEWLNLRQYGKEKPSYYHIFPKEGLFFHIGVQPGSYQVENFGGEGGV